MIFKSELQERISSLERKVDDLNRRLKEATNITVREHDLGLPCYSSYSMKAVLEMLLRRMGLRLVHTPAQEAQVSIERVKKNRHG